jgi:hypothetical protein
MHHQRLFVYFANMRQGVRLGLFTATGIVSPRPTAMVHRPSCGGCGVVCLRSIELVTHESFCWTPVRPKGDGGFGLSSGTQLKRHLVLAFFLPHDASCVTRSLKTGGHDSTYLPNSAPHQYFYRFGYSGQVT